MPTSPQNGDGRRSVDPGTVSGPSLDDPDNLRVFVSRINEGVYITSPDGAILDANPALLEIFGASSLEQLRRHRATDLVVDPERRAEQLRILRDEGSVRDFELQIRRLDGEVRTVLDTTIIRGRRSGGESYYLGILIDITARKRLERRYREMSRRDTLTGCHNRRYLQERRQELEDPAASWGCVMLDIDHFKALNDSFGHEHGDRVLSNVARFLYRHARADDIVVRLGGDEFAVLVRSVDSADMDSLVHRLLRHAESELTVQLSLGTACRRPGESIDAVVRRADHDMYAGRGMREGGGRRHQERRAR